MDRFLTYRTLHFKQILLSKFMEENVKKILI